jgi:toxin YoeB
VRQARVTRVFLNDLRWWVEMDRKRALRLLDLVDSVLCDPFAGIGKPEPLRTMGADVWSRRLTQEHRLVYRVTWERIDFLQARYHYGAELEPVVAGHDVRDRRVGLRERRSVRLLA